MKPAPSPSELSELRKMTLETQVRPHPCDEPFPLFIRGDVLDGLTRSVEAIELEREAAAHKRARPVCRCSVCIDVAALIPIRTSAAE